MGRFVSTLVATFFVAVFASSAQADESGWFDVIGLAGMYAIDDSNSQDSIDEYELYGAFTLPWNWGDQWRLSTEFHSGAGRYRLSGDNVHYLSLGPVARLQNRDWPVSIHIGVRPTLLSDSETPEIDIGGRYHFTSHVAIVAHLFDQVDLGFRYHHMSNAGTNKSNPGLDIYLVDLMYRF